MVEKRSIVKELGEEGLLLPGLVNSAFAANDRIKYYFTLLQTAREKAENPQLELPSLKTERENADEDPGRPSPIPRPSRNSRGRRASAWAARLKFRLFDH